MELAWLESFRIFSETLNFTHTAARRHLTQPAVFRHIQNLGEDVGVPLYRKVGRNLLLTEAGERLAGFAKEMPDRLAVMYSEVRRDGQEPTVALSAGQGAYLYLLGPAIRKFSSRKTSTLRLSVCDRDTSLAEVRDGTAHLAVTVLTTLPSDLETHAIYNFAPRLVVQKSHPLAGRKSVSLRTLDGLPLVVPSRGRPMREDLETRFASEELELNAALEANGWEIMMNFVALGLGSAVVNSCCTPPKGVVAIRIKDLPRTSYYVVRAKDGFRFASQERLWQAIIEETKQVQLFGT